MQCAEVHETQEQRFQNEAILYFPHREWETILGTCRHMSYRIETDAQRIDEQILGKTRGAAVGTRDPTGISFTPE
jgi:hypothetical protein